MTRRARLELGTAVSAALLLALPFLGKALHVDEPFFLDRAADLLAGVAWKPSAWAEYNNNPPMILWLLAGALKLVGWREAALRALLLPLDAAAAAFLYLLFARFLERPLAWTLLVLLSPAYAINMGHMMAEKPALAFSAAALYALVVGADERRPRWLAASALLLSLALLSKYAAVAALPAAAWYLHRRAAAPRAILAYLAAACAAPAVFVVWNTATGGMVLHGVAATLSGAATGACSRWPHRTRSLLCFFGGLAVLPMGWPWARGWPRRWALAAGAALLFLPVLDAASVRPLDRLFGAWLAAGAAGAFFAVFAARRARGRDLWLPWLLASASVAAAYWSVMARVVLFALPPFVLALGAAAQEQGGRWSRLAPRAAAAAAAALSLSLGWTDYRYAGAQRELAAELAAGPLAQGRRVWCGAALGLKHYETKAGARILDSARRWDEVRPGDIIVRARTTSNLPPPAHPFRANVTVRSVECAVPLRLLSGFGGEGGFYSNISGFLPFSLSKEPLEEFTIIEALPR